MRINNRKITRVEYSVEKNWMTHIHAQNWLCILVDNECKRNYIDEVISKIIECDVCYICTIGESCERNHDLIDEEIVFREVDVDDHYLPKHPIMTTWHTDFDEGIWFGIFAAYHDDIEIENVVILDMTSGAVNNQIDNSLKLAEMEVEKTTATKRFWDRILKFLKDS